MKLILTIGDRKQKEFKIENKGKFTIRNVIENSFDLTTSIDWINQCCMVIDCKVVYNSPNSYVRFVEVEESLYFKIEE